MSQNPLKFNLEDPDSDPFEHALISDTDDTPAFKTPQYQSRTPEQLPLFQKRPLTDTPVVSTTASPTFSPIGPSDNEEEEGLELHDARKPAAQPETPAVRPSLESQLVKTVPPTLDIPGQTRSRTNPEGRLTTSEKVVVVMIGLPARGKSYLSNKLTRYLNWLQINCRLFNVGSTRRKEARGSQQADFFSPNNKESVKMRELWALKTLENLLDYLLNGDGCVGIFDATNSTKLRRTRILEAIDARTKGKLKVLFLESICTDRAIIEENMRLKLSGPDYKNVNPEEAYTDFVERLKNYESAYETIDEEEEQGKSSNFQYVKMIDVGRKVITYNIQGYLGSQIIYYLLNFNLAERQIWITRHGESVDNVNGRIGGDSGLTDRGLRFAKALPRFMEFKRKEFREYQLRTFNDKIKIRYGQDEPQEPPEPSFSVWSSMLRRGVETTQFFNDEEFLIKELRMLDEIGAGKFDGMTYSEIQNEHPQEFQAKLHNKLSYRYPGVGGESYLDVINRLRQVISEIERTTDHVMLVTHRVVARVLLGYFLNLDKTAIGDLDVPLHTLYLLEPKPYGVDYSLYEYDEASDWFNKVDPQTLQNKKTVKQVGVGFKERKYSVVPTAPKRPVLNSESRPSSSSSVLDAVRKARTTSNPTHDMRRARAPSDSFHPSAMKKLSEKLNSLRQGQ